MSKKIIKLKISDIARIVKESINGITEKSFENEEQESPEINSEASGVELTLAKDKNGKFYVLKNAQSGNPEIVAKG